MDWSARIAAITRSRVVASTKLGGGDLGGATRLELADGRTIVAKQGPRAAREAAMLLTMRDAGVRVPEVIHAADDLLLLGFVEGAGRGGESGWRDLAAVLAQLHAPQAQAFGWEEANNFGPVAIGNARSRDWVRFWGEQRLACHAEHLGAVTGRRLEALAARLGELIPADPPAALLHGDLWGGNIIFDREHVAALIDPACCYGHREADIAMLTLFDHPPEGFFAACELDPGWRERLPVYRLWPLLVHLRLFGESYRAPVERALSACGV